MKKIYWSIVGSIMSIGIYAQPLALNKDNIDEYLYTATQEACGCIDSIDISNQSVKQTTSAINYCIEKKISQELLQATIVTSAKPSSRRRKQNNIIQDRLTQVHTKEALYYTIERNLMDSCPAIRKKIWAFGDSDTTGEFSQDALAIHYYNQGILEIENNDLIKAIAQVKLALRIDSSFVMAWNNLGVCYKNLKQQDSSIIAYKHALVYDSTNLLVLMNLATVYESLENFDQAISVYDYLQKTHADKPIVYLRLGYLYAFDLKNIERKNIERGLTLLCTAYNAYLLQKSPYRADVEKIIRIIHNEMRSRGREKFFYKILKDNQIY